MTHAQRMKGVKNWFIASAVLMPVVGWIASYFLPIPLGVGIALLCGWTVANMAIGYTFG